MSATDSHSATEYDSDTTESVFEDTNTTFGFGDSEPSDPVQPFQVKTLGLLIQVQYRHVDDLVQPKDERFWYSDGSVVLLTTECGFCVHRSFISRHSELFNKLFSQIQSRRPTTNHYLPVIHLEDSGEDLRHILATIYDRTCVCPSNFQMLN